MSDIEWTEDTWNPIVGCSKVSAGCDFCYAMGDSPSRFASKYERDGVVVLRGKAKKPGLTFLPSVRVPKSERQGRRIIEDHGDGTITVSLGKGAQWTGEVRLLPWKLDEPLRRKKPTTWFVNSLADMFHESIVGCEEGRRFLAAMFGVMAACPQHTFQILTKRPSMAREWFAWLEGEDRTRQWLNCTLSALRYVDTRFVRTTNIGDPSGPWPLPNAMIGTSVEDQARADERIPELLRIPAAVRFLSCEPLLGSLDLSAWVGLRSHCGSCGEYAGRYVPEDACPSCGATGCMLDTHGEDQASRYVRTGEPTIIDEGPPIDWVIVGGESGPKARPCEVRWIRSIVAQCKAAGLPVFVKQLGSRPLARDLDDLGPEAAEAWDQHGPSDALPLEGWIPKLRSAKGGDMSEWPEDLRVREMPR